jgi:oxygen-independent coproporphyrinogen-3 oxidase
MPNQTATLGLPSTPRFAALPPLALYVHIPWCLSKCPYCDFNSHERRGGGAAGLPEARYVDALFADLEFSLPSIWGRRVGTIFFGGGTPSLFSAETIDRTLAGIRARVPVAPDAEITLEANPGTFEQEKFTGFRDAGINRLSLGVQSFDPRHLKALGRVHDEREAHAAASAALAIFDNVNLDLMYALPGQTPEDARTDASAALAYRPPHLSFYHLTIEPNTLFHRHPPPLPDDDTAADIGDAIERALMEAGYVHYETSAFALTGRECRHNLNYWRFGDYLGIGAGAHSKLSFPERVLRQIRYRQPERYLEQVERGAPLAEEHEVGVGEIGFEFMLNALRLCDGFPVALFAERSGLPISVVQKELDEAERRGLLARDHQHIRPTELGRRFLNDLQGLFLPEERAPRKPSAVCIPSP